MTLQPHPALLRLDIKELWTGKEEVKVVEDKLYCVKNMNDNNRKIKLVLGSVALGLGILWYNIVIQSWLDDLGASQKLQDLIGALITAIAAYVAVINSTFSQSIKTSIQGIHETLTIWNLMGVIIGIILFIYTGMKSYGIKFKDLSKEYFHS